MESLVMPGEVVAKHARVEAECEKCHKPFDKTAQSLLCLDCHEDVAVDLGDERGYHGLNPSVRDRPCKTCHTEHLGRRADIVQLDRKTFEHLHTDLPLRGGHIQVACDDCHEMGKRYREAPSDCSGCHASEDPHEGTLGSRCDDCHAEVSWEEAHFDHDATVFPLEGRHREASCEGCHSTKRYKPTSHRCSACHEQDDVHAGRLGGACESCHTPDTWAASDFDHLRDAGFPLVGAHARTRCESCHKNGTETGATPTTCDGCHAGDDAHRGRFGRTCETCHTAHDWPSHIFEHDRSADFPLRGRHADVKCGACHRRNLYADALDTTCYVCHRGDDVHRGQQGQTCDTCHDERGWRIEVLFDHDLSRFPLIGAHNGVACADCHRSPAFKDVATECLSCHEDDDVHRGRLGARCRDCHNPAGWKAWNFDHDVQTKFRLEGAHLTTSCASCHREPVTEQIALSQRCVSCHDADDVHHGRFGSRCESCHETSTFHVIRAPQ